MEQYTADPSVLPKHIAETIDRSTIEPFAEAAWFAWRIRDGFLDITNGVWWNEDGSRVLSLATGTALHSYGDVDWETYSFRGNADGFAEDICCHDSREEADACALTFLLHGRFCSEAPA